MTLTGGVHPVSERRGGERWLTGGVRLSVSINMPGAGASFRMRLLTRIRAGVMCWRAM